MKLMVSLSLMLLTNSAFAISAKEHANYLNQVVRMLEVPSCTGSGFLSDDVAPESSSWNVARFGIDGNTGNFEIAIDYTYTCKAEDGYGDSLPDETDTYLLLVKGNIFKLNLLSVGESFNGPTYKGCTSSSISENTIQICSKSQVYSSEYSYGDKDEDRLDSLILTFKTEYYAREFVQSLKGLQQALKK